ncbi:chemotaxis protein CheB [Pseudorhodoferax sp. Leaf267]|uniref:chemotaxis protein CheB n=1 Tax=Pseudorhodoferax sp. Leaf267 TaxID=1736316 RepID=UPI00350EC83A
MPRNPCDRERLWTTAKAQRTDSKKPPRNRSPTSRCGASAGGVDALKQLFAAAAGNPQLAYIVVTHLPVDRVSHLADLLGRAGSLSATDAHSVQR